MKYESKNSPQALSQSEEGEQYIEKTIRLQREAITLRLRKQKSFDLVPELQKRNGPFVEIAGPTPSGYPIYLLEGEDKKPEEIDLFNLARARGKTYISNLYKGLPVMDTVARRFKGFQGSVDFAGDATNLPVKDNSLEIVFCSCLGSLAPSMVESIIRTEKPEDIPVSEKRRATNEKLFGYDYSANIELRKKAIQSAARVLKRDGLLIWFGGFEEDIESAKNAGFEVAYYQEKIYDSGDVARNIIFVLKA